MKKCLFVFFCLTYFSAFATDYYISSEGRDSADGISPETPWQSLSKINSITPFLKPGDKVLFKRGNIFTGTLRITTSGLPGNPIIVGAYGQGPDPELSGFTTIKSWKKYKSGIYLSHVRCESPVNIVTVNGMNTPKGRWPDSNLLYVDCHDAKISFTDNELCSAPDWNGAKAVIRKNAYIWDVIEITKHKDNLIVYSGDSDYEINDGSGYFIQENIRTLNLHGEWYYEGNIIYMYFGTDPGNHVVKVSSTDQLVFLNGARYINIENISFSGANTYSIQIRNSGYITIQNCKINHTGNTAIFGPWWGNSPGCRIINNTIENSANNAIKLNGDHTYASILGNRIINTGLVIGLGGSGDETYNAVNVFGDNSMIKNNIIENTGYMGINFRGENSVVANNLIVNFNIVKNDGGGIYTYAGSGTPKSGQRINRNIVVNGIGSCEGIPDRSTEAFGIYIDDRSLDIEIAENTVSNCSTAGIYLHNAHEISIYGNIIYNNGYGSLNHGCQVLLVHDNYSPDDPIRNVRVFKNLLFNTRENTRIISFASVKNDISQFGSSENNYFMNASGIDKIIKLWEKGWREAVVDISLDEWRQKTGQDLITTTLPDIVRIIKNSGESMTLCHSGSAQNMYNGEFFQRYLETRLEYNSNDTTKTILLDRTYFDVKGSKHEKYIVLSPFSSAILMRLKDGI